MTTPASSPAPRLLPRLILLAAAALLALAAWWAVSVWRDWQKGFDPETVVAASLLVAAAAALTDTVQPCEQAAPATTTAHGMAITLTSSEPIMKSTCTSDTLHPRARRSCTPALPSRAILPARPAPVSGSAP